MIDLHCHVLAAIDDGPPDLDDAAALAAAAAAAGTRTLVATPHVSARYPNRAPAIAAAVDTLNRRLSADGIDLLVRPGAEIAMTHLDELSSEDLLALRLAGGDYLLIESPFALAIDALPPMLAALQDAGHRIVLAHPERCPGFHRRPELLAELVETGVLTSVTAASLTGRFGREVARFTLDLARSGLIHNVASDAHDLSSRPPVITDHIERAGLAPHADYLTVTLPNAVIAGQPLPDHPGAVLNEPPRRRWWSRRPDGQ